MSRVKASCAFERVEDTFDLRSPSTSIKLKEVPHHWLEVAVTRKDCGLVPRETVGPFNEVRIRSTKG